MASSFGHRRDVPNQKHMLINYGKLRKLRRLRKLLYPLTKMQLYNYQNVINKQTIYHLCKKKDKYLYEVFESIQEFSTKDIYVQ